VKREGKSRERFVAKRLREGGAFKSKETRKLREGKNATGK